MPTSPTTKTEEITPLGICAIFRNEALYLKEWIEFHRMVGVSKFFLYNNRSDDNWYDVLLPYMEEGIVDVTEWDFDVPCQLTAYQHLIERANRRKVWMAFIDCDEFLFSPVHDSVLEVLAGQDRPIGLGVNWMCFGSGGHKRYSKKPVIERFHKRPNESLYANSNIKSIVRLDQDVHVRTTPHFFFVENGTYTESGELILHVFTDGKKHESKLLRLNHYRTKSLQEWKKREPLGKPDLVRPVEKRFYDELAGTEVDDRTIQRFLPELKKRLNK